MATRYQFVDDSGETRLAGFLVPEPGGSSSLVTVTRDFTSAEILTLDTPVQLVAAPAANQLLFVVAASIYLAAGATPYTYTDILAVNWGNPGSFQAAETPSGFIAEAADSVCISDSPINNTNTKDQLLGLGLFARTFGNPTDGDGTMRIVLKYVVIDAAP